jgi:hypothetical protein
MEACYGGTDVVERPCAVARGIDINSYIHITVICNGRYSRTGTIVRSGVAVMQRPWPLAKGNGFILKWVSLRAFTGHYLSPF